MLQRCVDRLVRIYQSVCLLHQPTNQLKPTILLAVRGCKKISLMVLTIRRRRLLPFCIPYISASSSFFIPCIGEWRKEKRYSHQDDAFTTAFDLDSLLFCFWLVYLRVKNLSRVQAAHLFTHFFFVFFAIPAIISCSLQFQFGILFVI